MREAVAAEKQVAFYLSSQQRKRSSTIWSKN